MTGGWRRILAVAAVGLLAIGCRRRQKPDLEPVGHVPPEIVSFLSNGLTLYGVLYKPEGAGPFPAVLFNHDSGPGMTSEVLFKALGPRFVSRGWVFFAPWRRGQGLSEAAGRYIVDEINATWMKDGIAAAAEILVHRHETDQLDDQLAGLAWLRTAAFVASDRIAVAGASFGGIQAVLGVEHANYCAAIDMAGAAYSWHLNPQLQKVMLRAVRNARAPVFLFQAENDVDVTPTRILAAAMESAGKPHKAKIYPPSGIGPVAGHGLPLRDFAVWFEDAIGFLENYCK
jgi:carboxymethylenebutenolidase